MTNNDKGAGALISFQGAPVPPPGAPVLVAHPSHTASLQKESKNQISTEDLAEQLLRRAKENLIVTHDEDNALIRGFILSAIDYAEGYQKRSYKHEKMPPATEQAVIMLSSHFYESRDGSTAGFFAGNVGAAKQVWDAVHRLLMTGKRWEI